MSAITPIIAKQTTVDDKLAELKLRQRQTECRIPFTKKYGTALQKEVAKPNPSERKVRNLLDTYPHAVNQRKELVTEYDPNFSIGGTPLTILVRKIVRGDKYSEQNLRITRILLDHGADPNGCKFESIDSTARNRHTLETFLTVYDDQKGDESIKKTLLNLLFEHGADSTLVPNHIPNCVGKHLITVAATETYGHTNRFAILRKRIEFVVEFLRHGAQWLSSDFSYSPMTTLVNKWSLEDIQQLQAITPLPWKEWLERDSTINQFTIFGFHHFPAVVHTGVSWDDYTPKSDDTEEEFSSSESESDRNISTLKRLPLLLQTTIDRKMLSPYDWIRFLISRLHDFNLNYVSQTLIKLYQDYGSEINSEEKQKIRETLLTIPTNKNTPPLARIARLNNRELLLNMHEILVFPWNNLLQLDRKNTSLGNFSITAIHTSIEMGWLSPVDWICYAVKSFSFSKQEKLFLNELLHDCADQLSDEDKSKIMHSLNQNKSFKMKRKLKDQLSPFGISEKNLVEENLEKVPKKHKKKKTSSSKDSEV